MARLKSAPPMLTAPRPRLAAPQDDAGRSAYRRKNAPGYALYSDRRWRGDDKGVGGLRWAVLVRDQFTCRMCGVMHSDTSQLEADHIVPHKGDPALFWDAGGIWCVCGECHRTVCQRIEARHQGDAEAIRAAKMAAADSHKVRSLLK